MFTKEEKAKIAQELANLPEAEFWPVMEQFEELFGHVPSLMNEIRWLWLTESRKRTDALGLVIR